MENDELTRLFFEEAYEQLQVIGDSLIRLEITPDDTDTLGEMFRAVHSFKGGAASMGFEQTSILSHELENLLETYRKGVLRPERGAVDCMFRCLDSFRRMIEKLDSGGTEDEDISELLNELKVCSVTILPSERPLEDHSQNHGQGLKESDLQEVRKLVDSGENAFDVEIELDPGDIKSARALLLYGALSSSTNIVHVYPDIDDYERIENEKYLSFILTTHMDESELRDITGTTGVLSVDIRVFTPDIEIDPREIEKPEENVELAANAGTAPVPGAKAGTGNKSLVEGGTRRQRTGTIRVETGRLDSVMNLIGELVIGRTRLNNITNELNSFETKMNEKNADQSLVADLRAIKSEFDITLQQIRRTSGDLREKVMTIRMMPVETVFARFKRLVRDISQSMNKKVTLEISGEETMLDKTVIDALGEPLTHILRNSLAHGIESTEERLLLDKPENGKISLSAQHEGNHAIIQVGDDGRGINVSKVRDEAIKRHLISTDQADSMDDNEIILQIFSPGFSTSQEIDDISGRGVGLDAVAKTLDSLNAVIDVETFENKGTVFTMKFPLTLAITQALLVEVSGEIFALSLWSIHEVIRVAQSDLRNIEGSDVITHRETVLPILNMRDVLEFEEEKGLPENLYVVVVRWVEKRIGLVVDRIIGQQEIVVKNIEEYFDDDPLIEGATVLSDGTVALILNSNALVDIGVNKSNRCCFRY